jgi:G:T-mismatch repair DNA endonuclease (very short patch repair protein)
MHMEELPAIRHALISRFTKLRNLRNRGFRSLIVVQCEIPKVSRITQNVLTRTIESVRNLATNSPSLMKAIF